jgi:hypothetical protein
MPLRREVISAAESIDGLKAAKSSANMQRRRTRYLSASARVVVGSLCQSQFTRNWDGTGHIRACSEQTARLSMRTLCAI